MIQEIKAVAKTTFRPEDCFSGPFHTPLGELYYKLSTNFLALATANGNPGMRARALEEFNETLCEARLEGDLPEARKRLTAYWDHAVKIAPYLKGSRDMLVPLLTLHLT